MVGQDEEQGRGMLVGERSTACRLGRRRPDTHESERPLRLVRPGVAAHRAAAIVLRTFALATDDPDERIGLLRSSIQEAESGSAQLEQARSLVELGAALRRARRRRESRDPLREGLALARESGSIELVERAAAELDASAAQVPERPVSGIGALTPREHKVAQLASSEGLSNRKIAERLVVTRRTVESHLTSVYRKLGVDGREALTDALSAA